ncbi:hypothetical protein MMIC_P1570 [Mariprofundus micogutta]|uniref:Preprotein translocase subunit SecA n=1 Tax=Mariprofundus micogutta TaxID=1921010 RepID=A0A1L8CNW0_9PROT|nr:SEC-C metal-binding domain-containing protein [Mariprofundus micogutta]GAV20601.1 hypothetical protein MMIC_P1570 [Mariprofundus micogutta]
MVRKVQRNEPCPCGSGKKYKRCCGLKARDLASNRINRRDGIQKSLGWINHAHQDDIGRWLEDSWLKDIPTEERTGITSADPRIRSVHDVNLLEYLVAEGVFTDEEGNTSSPLQLILDADLDLDEQQRAYLNQLAERPLRLYQVTECIAGKSYSLALYPDDNSEVVEIEDAVTSRMFDAGDIVGLRLIECEGAWETSGAIYHIPEEHAFDLVQQLQDGEPDSYSKTLTNYWLKLVAAHV